MGVGRLAPVASSPLLSPCEMFGLTALQLLGGSRGSWCHCHSRKSLRVNTAATHRPAAGSLRAPAVLSQCPVGALCLVPPSGWVVGYGPSPG